MVQKTKYLNWGIEKYGRPAFWHKSNWKVHQSYHEVILTDEQTFLDTLKDPDAIFPALHNPNRTCYYKFDAFQGNTKYSKHAQVIIIENCEAKPAPIKGDYVIVATAMDRDDIPEKGKVRPKFAKKKLK